MKTSRTMTPCDDGLTPGQQVIPTWPYSLDPAYHLYIQRSRAKWSTCRSVDMLAPFWSSTNKCHQIIWSSAFELHTLSSIPRTLYSVVSGALDSDLNFLSSLLRVVSWVLHLTWFPKFSTQMFPKLSTKLGFLSSFLQSLGGCTHNPSLGLLYIELRLM